jgi:hypothetical protein
VAQLIVDGEVEGDTAAGEALPWDSPGGPRKFFFKQPYRGYRAAVEVVRKDLRNYFRKILKGGRSIP